MNQYQEHILCKYVQGTDEFDLIHSVAHELFRYGRIVSETYIDRGGGRYLPYFDLYINISNSENGDILRNPYGTCFFDTPVNMNKILQIIRSEKIDYIAERQKEAMRKH